MRKCTILVVLISLVSANVWAANESLNNTGKRAAIVGKSAIYGAAGGLVVGVASQAFKRKTKNIFVFGSLGLYAGIAMGLYIVMAPRGATPYEGPDTYEDFGSYDNGAIWEKPTSTGALQAKANPFVAEPGKGAEVSLVSLDF